MATILQQFNNLISGQKKEALSKSKAYRITRYTIAGLLLAWALLTLLSAWYSGRTIETSFNNIPPDIPAVPGVSPVIPGITTIPEVIVTTNRIANRLTAYSDSLYQADIAFGILSIILGIALLGSRKQPFNIVLLTIGIVFIVLLIVLSSLTFTGTETLPLSSTSVNIPNPQYVAPKAP